MNTRSMMWLPGLLLLAAGCAEDLEPDDTGPDAPIIGDIEDRGDGTFALTVDATDEEAWVYFHFEQGVVAETEAWDLALRRFVVDLPEDGLARYAPDDGLASATQAPEDGWLADTDDETRAFDTWYAYDPVNHVLSPNDGIWYVKAGERYYGLRIEDYYDDAGTAGHMALAWTTVEAPANPPMVDVVEPAPTYETVTLTPTRDDDWTRYSLVDGSEVGEDEAWDFALFGVRVATNSGTSGEGMGGAFKLEAPVLDAVTGADAGTFVVDEMLPVPGPPGSGEYSGSPAFDDWYDYNPMSHQVAPKDDRVYGIRLADGGIARLKVTGYAEGRMTVEYQYAGDGVSTF